ncbi:hypothetical protein JZO83_06830 [Enterococcus sp. DIV1298c]|uniref:Uncharacterized protein n=1 Tax=Candidatus Enterococcus mangumiae TaxID=2230878 RepID=A0ABZ2SZR2_9ENTE|nr:MULTISPECIES: hypothetical protein [unclassified Enterococcus]MBO0461460.1 hypothetical protein [Enterococcus sp. DIV1298c]MBO0490489.1 hypothetical protein [Enterococcus sp. DIV1094]
MEKIFEMKFKIVKDIYIENFIGEYGYFSVTIDNEHYGIILEEEVEDFTVSLYDWFDSFLRALEILNTESYVLINDIESFNTWIEIYREKEILSISKVSGAKVGQGGWIRTEKLSNPDYQFWKDKKMLFSDFRTEVLEKSEYYLSEIIKLNSLQNKNIRNFKKLVEKLKL